MEPLDVHQPVLLRQCEGAPGQEWEEGGSGGPGIVKALAENPGCLAMLALAIYSDILSDTPPARSTTDALREALAEQKVSEVWDPVDETLKWCVMNVQNKG